MSAYCRSGKRGYPTEAEASGALAQARTAARVEEAAGSCRRRERRAYRCDWCADWHLTSRAKAA